MPTPNYIPTKVLLHDPDTVTNPKSLYPVTGLNALVAGVDSSSNATYITTSDGKKIKYQYLEIMGSDGKVTSSYLPIAFTDGGKISNDDLDIFTTEGDNIVIKSELLPSFVDDVVAVPVISNISQASGPLVIVKSTVEGEVVYTFHYRAANNTYPAGGGETGKIYTAADGSTADAGAGSIFRCVSGDPTRAIKISENPYGISTVKTNGVYIDNTDGNLTAKADKAAADAFGTVKINETATNNVKITVNDGVIAASAGTANANTPGVVIAVGTDAESDAMTSAFGETYIVPNVGYMRAYVSAYIVPIGSASYESKGVVQIQSGGNIDCTNGIISVPLASASVAGVVKVIDTINTAAEGNAGKVVTQTGIVNYVTQQLNGYQTTLTPVSGIDITSGNIGVKTSGAIVISSGNVTARDATGTDTGVTLITGDSSFIANGSATLGGHPIAVNPVAVRDYVAAQITSSGYNLQIADDTHRGGFRTSAANTGLGMTTPVGDNTADVLRIQRAAPIVFNNNNEITVQSASFQQSGAVIMRELSAATNNDNPNTPPKAYEVKSAIEYASSTAVTEAVTSANDYTDSAISQVVFEPSAGKGIGVTGETIWVDNGSGLTFEEDTDKLMVRLTDPVYFDPNNSGAINVSSATTTAGGIVQIVNTSAGIDDLTNSGGAVPTVSAVNTYVTSKITTLAGTAAGYAETSAATTPALGMVRIISGGGIGVVTGTGKGNIYLESATTANLGGVKLAATQTGINAANNAIISANVALPVHIDNSNNINVSKATTTAVGVVRTMSTAAAVNAALTNMTNSGYYVPDAAGMSNYASSLTGPGLIWTNSKYNVDTYDPIIISTYTSNNVTHSAVAIRIATAETGATLTSAARGAVYVRGSIRDAATITAGTLQANTVPTESAVRDAVDTASAGVISTIDARLYITYTPIQ